MSHWKTFRAVLTVCAALGWWGIWFPELAVWTEAVCAVKDEDESASVQKEKDVVEYETAREVLDGLMHADREQIRIRSRLLEAVERYLQKK